MPTYEYECTKCKHRFEAFQKMSDKPFSSCPKCGKKLKRLLGSGAGIIFKGSGFYATDYRKDTKLDQKPINCPKAKEGCNACQ
ncbi:MAG: FmdB family zinc ribbon protein, partial [Candidatus Omnitrophota bacterium]